MGRMQITDGTVVAIHYTLKGDDGNVIDQSEEGAPLYYLHGHNNIVEGLEEALAGRSVGDQVDVAVPPEKGYGRRNPALVLEVPKNQLPPDLNPQKGMVLQMNAQGRAVPVTITRVKLNSVEVDANHQLVDCTLHFSVNVHQVRKATKEELEHGHAHSPGHSH